MKKTPRRHISSKWAKTKAIQTVAALRANIPVTKRMTRITLRQMLRAYKMVYVKPNSGMCGDGVMRVEWRGEQEEYPFVYQEGERRKKFKDFATMYASIRQATRKRRYLVQKGIHLLTYKGNRFDIRVMVQQTPVRTWETTGIIGRVAHPRKIVTNFHNGGKLKSPEVLLHGYMSKTQCKQLMRKLRTLGLQAAVAMQSRFKGVNEIGVDVALDRELHPWILEVNTSPDPYIFRRLKDKRIFAKVMRYAKGNGRFK